jgi:hypothetical protein
MSGKNKVFLTLFLLMLFASIQMVRADNNVSLEWAGDKQFIQDYDANIIINIKNNFPDTIYAKTLLLHFSWTKPNLFLVVNCSKYVLPNEILSFNYTTHAPDNATIGNSLDFACYLAYKVNNTDFTTSIYRTSKPLSVASGKSIYTDQPVNPNIITGVIIFLVFTCTLIYGGREKTTEYMKNNKKYVSVLIFLVIFIIYTIFLSMNYTPYLLPIKTQQGFSLTGDEPHYVLMTSALLSGKIDCNSIYAGLPNMAKHIRNDTGSLLYGLQISSHPYGLPLLMTLPYSLGENFLHSGVYGMLIFVCVLMALISVMIYKISMFITKENMQVSIFTTLAFSFATGIFMWSGQLFTENVIAFFITLAIYKLLTGTKKVDFILSGIALSVLPFIKYQGIFITGGCLLILGLLYIRGNKNLKYIIIPLLLSILIYVLYMHLFIGFGSIDMLGTNTDLGQPTINILGFNISKTLYFAIFGLLIDRNYGLFIYSPILILSIFGIFQTIKNRNPAIYLSAFIFGFWFCAISGFIGWMGWISIPGKYTIVILPLLSIPFALGMLDLIKNIKYIVSYLTLFLVGLILNIYIASNRLLGYVMFLTDGTDYNRLMFGLKNIGLNTALIPDFNNVWLNNTNTILIVIWTIIFCTVVSVLLYISYKITFLRSKSCENTLITH